MVALKKNYKQNLHYTKDLKWKRLLHGILIILSFKYLLYYKKNIKFDFACSVNEVNIHRDAESEEIRASVCLML